MKLNHACVIALLLTAGAAARVEAQQTESVAAVVNDEVISTFDVRMRSSLILATTGIQPTLEAMRQVRGQALRALVDERLQVQEARDRKIIVSEDEVDAALVNIAGQNKMTAPQFTKELAAAGGDMQSLRAQLRAEIAWRRLINARFGTRMRVSDSEVESTLERIKSNSSKQQYHIAEILLPANTEKEIEDATMAANRLLQEMQKGNVSFAAVARQFSAAPSAAAGGDLGWLAESELRPDLAAAVGVLKPGQASNPVRVPGGVQIVVLRGVQAGVDPKSMAQVTLRQVSAPARARDALNKARPAIRGCANLEQQIRNVPDARVIELGATAEADLTDAMRATVSETSTGLASKVIEGSDQASFVVVCARDTVDGALPSRIEVQNRLMDAQLALLSQRYLMDLRRESTIITR